MRAAIEVFQREHASRWVGVYFPLLGLALVSGAISAVNPFAAGVGAIGIGAAVAGLVLLSQPQKALQLSFFLLLLSVTKMRKRDVGALLAGSIDAQIIFELILYGVVSLILVLNVLRNARQDFKPVSVEVMLFSYVAFALCSTLWSNSFLYTLVRASQLVILCTFSFVAVRILGPQQVLRILMVTLTFTVLLFTAVALLVPAADGTIIHLGIQRFSWFAVHPIMAAVLAAEALILLMSEALFAPGSWHRRLGGVPLWGYALLLFVILLATRSRGPLLAFAGTIGVLWVMRYINPWIIGLTGCVGVTVGAVLFISSGVPLTDVFRQLLSSENLIVSFLLRGQEIDHFLRVTGRIELWQGVYTLFLDRPILGYGYAASRSVLPQMIDWAAESHNSLIESLLCLGIIGTVLIWVPLIRTLLLSLLHTLQIMRTKVWHQAAVSGLLLFIFLNSFGDATFTGFPTYDQVVFFSAMFAHERLKFLARLPKRDTDASTM